MISGISGNSFLWQKYQNIKQYPQDDHKSKDLDYQTDIDKHQSNVENFIFHDHVDQSKYAKKLSYVNENECNPLFCSNPDWFLTIQTGKKKMCVKIQIRHHLKSRF